MTSNTYTEYPEHPLYMIDPAILECARSALRDTDLGENDNCDPIADSVLMSLREGGYIRETYRTKTGKVLTDDDIEALAAEAAEPFPDVQTFRQMGLDYPQPGTIWRSGLGGEFKVHRVKVTVEFDAVPDGRHPYRRGRSARELSAFLREFTPE